ncbi:hypothetical protein ANANG_G00115020 [Anguilla anguilla]|uniref:Uncharacterized protein n=1 Tax=Anguilla anguilla TaxID=7936 RepID=A0A9D3MI55_ANGAN|nr:hypothetical protein ANANG_G00115020 [Anguilla anguilla]
MHARGTGFAPAEPFPRLGLELFEALQPRWSLLKSTGLSHSSESIIPPSRAHSLRPCHAGILGPSPITTERKQEFLSAGPLCHFIVSVLRLLQTSKTGSFGTGRCCEL